MVQDGFFRELNRAVDLPQRLRYLGQRLQRQHAQVERFSIALYDADNDEVRTYFATGAEGHALTHYWTQLSSSRSLREIAEQRQARIINDMAALSCQPQVHTQKILAQGWCASYTAPLVCGDVLVGFIFFNSRHRGAFQGPVLSHLELISQLIAQLVYQEISSVKTLTAAVQSAMTLCAERDPETGEHLRRMGLFSRLIGAHLSPPLTDRDLELLLLFAPLHDVGKIAVPDHILLKPGPLTQEEFEQMKRHTSRGSDMLDLIIEQHGLSNVDEVQMLRSIVRHHHEKLDGSGYPDGLKGREIPLAARIVTVADIFDALTSVRCYKSAWSVDEAFDELIRLRDRGQLDTQCVQVLIDQRESVEAIMRAWPDFRSQPHFAGGGLKWA